MGQINDFLQRIVIKTIRIRHNKGYGVHSPFAYNLIREVFYETLNYYGYTDLKCLRKSQKQKLAVAERVDKLMFRMANFAQPQNAAIVGGKAGITGDYVKAGCKKASVTVVGNADDMPDGIDFCYTAPNEDFIGIYNRFAPNAHDRSVFIAAGIYATKTCKENWKRICDDKRSIVTFDLFDVGIVFFDHNLNKQNYIVSF